MAAQFAKTLKPDILIYSDNGSVNEGSSVVTEETINTSNGNYFVKKEYWVERAYASLEYPIYNPELFNTKIILSFVCSIIFLSPLSNSLW